MLPNLLKTLILVYKFFVAFSFITFGINLLILKGVFYLYGTIVARKSTGVMEAVVNHLVIWVLAIQALFKDRL